MGALSSVGRSLGFGGRASAGKTASTGFSTLRKGRVTLDPSIRALQEQGLLQSQALSDRTGSELNDFLSKSRGLRQRFEGNRAAFTEARVNPIRAANALRRGQTERNIGQRNLSGSSFANQSLDSLAFESGRQEADAIAQAENENLAAMTGLDQNMITAVFQAITQQAQLNGDTFQAARDRLTGELSALGLGNQQIQAMAQAYENQLNRGAQFRGDVVDFAKDLASGSFTPKPTSSVGSGIG